MDWVVPQRLIMVILYEEGVVGFALSQRWVRWYLRKEVVLLFAVRQEWGRRHAFGQSAEVHMGPIQVFLLGFEDFMATGAIAEELATLRDAGIVRVVDARFLLKDDEGDLIALRASDLDASERDDLRAAAGALIGLGAGAVLGGDEGAIAGAFLGADAALDMGPIGLTADEVAALGSDMEVGDALLLLVLENVWATGLRDAFRLSGLVYAEQDYVTPEGLVALGALLGVEAALA